MVLAGQHVKAGEHSGELRLGAAGDWRGDPHEDLNLKQRVGRPELSRERVATDPSLDELGGRCASATTILAADEIGERVCRRLAGLVVVTRAAQQSPSQPTPLARRDGQQVDGDCRGVAVCWVERVDRAGKRGERIGVEAGRAQRLAAGPRQDQLRAGDLDAILDSVASGS